MIYEGITNGTYAPTTDSTLDDLNKFQYFLRRNFNNKFTHCKDMRLQFARWNNSRKFKIPTYNFTSGYIHVQCSKGYSQKFETIMPN